MLFIVLTYPRVVLIMRNMKQQKTTTRNTKLWGDVDARVLSIIDQERKKLGGCSRAAIVRMLLVQWADSKSAKDAAAVTVNG